jgi:hypothetical protein
MKSDSALSASSTTTTLKKEGNLKDKWQQQGTKKPHLFLSLVLKLGLVSLRLGKPVIPSRSGFLAFRGQGMPWLGGLPCIACM